MDLTSMEDISYIDIDELGIRPSNWIDDGNDVDFDDTINGYFSKEKQNELHMNSNGTKSITNEDNISVSDEDDLNYEIDPETGEKIFRGRFVEESPSFSSPNNHWIEEYLSTIESSSSSSSSTTTTTTQKSFINSDLLLDSIPVSNVQTDFNWFSKYVSLDESENNIMFPDQVLTSQLSDEHQKHLPQTQSPPIFIQLRNKTSSDSLMNFLSVSNDDDHSISGSSNSSRRHRLYSSLESDSPTRDSEATYDDIFVEPKLEKIEYDEHCNLHSHLSVRRLSTRAHIQGQQDEEILQQYSIPLTVKDITQSTTDEYNRQLARLTHLSPEQIHVIKDIRRRGKNKIAAQNCRKRKAINVEALLEEVDKLKRLKHELQERKRSYQQQIVDTRNQYEYLHRQVLPDRQLPPAISVK